MNDYLEEYIAIVLTGILVLLVVLTYRLETGATFRAGAATQAVSTEEPTFIIPGQSAKIQKDRELFAEIDRKAAEERLKPPAYTMNSAR